MLRRFASCFALLGLCLGMAARDAHAAPFALTAGDLTINVGQNGTLDVIWSSTQTLNYLNTQFVLRAVTGAAGGAVFTEVTAGVPPMPPITDSNYLFYGNSAAVTAGGNPASVGIDAWAGDSYFLSDTTDDGLDFLQNGSRLWTRLDITGVSAGTYQLHLLSSEYDYGATSGVAVPLTGSDLSGGLITVNSVTSVPEPGGFVLGLSVLAFALFTARPGWRRTNQA